VRGVDVTTCSRVRRRALDDDLTRARKHANDERACVVRELLTGLVMARPRHRHIVWSGVIALLALDGCAYRAGSFTSDDVRFHGVYVSVGCLDLAIDRQHRPTARDVITYAFGNRCDEPAIVDLAAARVHAVASDGTVLRIMPLDPRHEIRAMRLDIGAAGQEAIAYPSDRPLSMLCVDAASIARVQGSRWICF
jgi:hypothetical protein